MERTNENSGSLFLAENRRLAGIILPFRHLEATSTAVETRRPERSRPETEEGKRPEKLRLLQREPLGHQCEDFEWTKPRRLSELKVFLPPPPPLSSSLANCVANFFAKTVELFSGIRGIP